MAAESLIREAKAALRAHAPFSEMTEADVDFVARRVRLRYFAVDEELLGPGGGAPTDCFIVKQGTVNGLLPDESGRALAPALELSVGDLFPIGSLMASRPPRTRYVASSDLFCWVLPHEHFDSLLQQSAVFLDFCKRRMAALMELSMQVVQARYASQSAQWRLMSQPLSAILTRSPVGCTPDTSLSNALAVMEREAVGAMLVFESDGGLLAGIFTRQDVIGRIVLPALPLQAPISSVMSHPVAVLPVTATVADAVMLMAECAIRHVPIVDSGRVVGMVTERDLFALQRRNLRQIGDQIAKAGMPEQLVTAAADIREWSRSLVAQGLSARHLTRLISRLNDALTRRLVEILAERAGVELQRFCWLAFGSEGREEQTIATDQDNGIAYSDDASISEQARFLALGHEVNVWLDRCGYSLCRGGIMAGQPQCCLSISGWRERFEHWISHGSPQDLLNASIFFDLRPLAGRLEFGVSLRNFLSARVPESTRFQKLMSENALRNAPPRLFGPGVLGRLLSESQSIDLKLNGTMPIVDAARILSLANGLTVDGTAQRLEALVVAGVLTPEDARSWVDAFEFLQSLRLRAHDDTAMLTEKGGNPNSVRVDLLSSLDRRILAEAFRQVRKLQRRLALDYP